jgi:predicted TIM-barrel fold metal-dependent hydrolase
MTRATNAKSKSRTRPAAHDIADPDARESGSLRPAASVTRRDALRAFAGLAAGAALGTHPAEGIAAPPPAPAAEIDVHCHVFNIRDQAAYAFVLDVVLSNALLKLFLAPLARFVTYMIWSNAPGYVKEKQKLQDILSQPLVAKSTPRNSDAIEPMFKKGLAGFVDAYTTFGDNPGPQSSPDNDRFIEKLFQTFQFAIFIDERISPQANRRKVLAAIDPLYARMHEQLLQNQRRRGRLGTVRTVERTLAFDQGPSAAAYIAQFTHYWAGRLSNFRYQLTDELPTFFTDAAAPPRLVTPATLDITNWLENSEIDTTPLEIAQQAELMSLIALKEYKNPLVHGFIGFDPWRYIDDTAKNRHPNALEVVDTALTQYGFVGVKLYPPMGFRATHNFDRDDNKFLGKLTAGYPGLGARLDAALDTLFLYCLEHDVPIMAHCAASQGTSDENSLCADPKFWKELLDKPPVGTLDYAKLRINLGHFGGIWNFDNLAPSSTHIAWTRFVVEDMMKSGKYPNLYTDIGDFSVVLDRTQDEIDEDTVITGKLGDLITNWDPLRYRVMYGSDWIFLGIEPGFEAYYAQMRSHLGPVLAPSDPTMADFLWKNAARFLGLVSGTVTPTLTRLRAFYTAHGLDPAVLEPFRAPPA